MSSLNPALRASGELAETGLQGPNAHGDLDEHIAFLSALNPKYTTQEISLLLMQCNGELEVTTS